MARKYLGFYAMRLVIDCYMLREFLKIKNLTLSQLVNGLIEKFLIISVLTSLMVGSIDPKFIVTSGVV